MSGEIANGHRKTLTKNALVSVLYLTITLILDHMN